MTEREKNEKLLIDGVIDELPLIAANTIYCNARRKGKRSYCKRPPGWGTLHHGEGRCKLHGGSSARGIAHGRYTDGRYSKTVPSKLMQQYERSLNDPRLMSLRDEIAAVDAKIVALFEALRSLPSGKSSSTSIATLRKEIGAAKGAVEKSHSEADFVAILKQFEAMVSDITSERQIWQDVGCWIDRRQRLVDSEVKHMIQSQTMVSASEITTLVGGVLKVIKENIKDRKTLDAIGHGISRLLPTSANGNVLEAEVV